MQIQDMSPKQLFSYRDSDARINIWEGAVRSGKSYASLVRFLEFILEGPPGPLLISGRTEKTIRQNIISFLNELLGGDVVYKIGKGEIHLYNRLIHVVGASDERAEGKIRGATFAGAYVDEISILPESFFKMILSRLSIDGSKLFATTNPDSPFHWLKRDFLGRKEELDLKSWNFTLEDNPSLSPIYKDRIKKEYSGLWYQRFIEGKWVLAEGTIYDFFDNNIHVIPESPGLSSEYIVGVDYGTTNPTAFAMIGYDPNMYPNMWLEREYYFDSRAQMKHKTDADFSEDLKNFIADRPVRAIYIDPAAASFKTELRRSNTPNLMDAKNDVLDGIRFHGTLLSQGSFKICSWCKDTISEYGSYMWDPKASERGVDKPVKQYDHLMDAIRYALYSHFYGKSKDGSLTPDDIRRIRAKSSGYRSHTIEDFFSIPNHPMGR